ncbi:DMT family transporter [Clostridium sp. MSJ-11]|uniref:DMT family transporter n=1 Tax=Clostridium mobile TaxID=2841512 RepID=A0ABS6EKC7_9CLOT|nr:DMT family transporter [Clostridium mobile]MBU5484869.1 DMT family transporter [Clostridium mobile]
MENKKQAHVLAMVLMTLWGLSYLSIKVVVEEINPVLSAFYRFLLASIILFIFLKIKYPAEKILKEDRVKVALGGLFGVSLYFYFENYSVLFTSASNVAVLISSIPVFTLLTQMLIFKEKMTPGKIGGAILSVIGIFIIIISKEKVSFFSSGTIGDIMALMAALCWVVYTTITSKFKGNYKSITITTYQTLWGCLFLSPAIFIFEPSMPSTKAIFNLLYLSIFCSCIGYAIYVYCLNKLGSTVITTYINLQPIISLISAKVLLKEKITLWQLLGSLIIISGVFLVSFSEKISLNNLEEMI